MTSDTHQFEGQEDHGGLAMNASGQSEQATMSLAAGQIAERSKPLFRFPNAVSLRAKGSPRPSLSTGHIPSEAEATAVESSVDESGTDEPACTEPSKQFQSFCTDSDLAQVSAVQGAEPPALEAFDLLERDLAELASACSSMGSAAEQSHECAGAERELSEPPAPLSAEAVLPQINSVGALDAMASGFAVAGSADQSLSPQSQYSHEELSTMNAQAQFQPSGTSFQSPAMETDGVLLDVQSTLDSLAGMAQGLSQQKLENVKMREALEERRLATVERERQLVEREDRLAQLEQRLQDEKYEIERIAEQNAAVLAERSSALQSLAETVDGRDRATNKRAEVLNQEQQNIERQLSQVRARTQELDEREIGLQRQGAELADRFKQLLDAKERFGVIVRGFNETVRFNTTYSAISQSVATGDEA